MGRRGTALAPLFQQTVACGLVRGGALFILTSFQRETNVLRIRLRNLSTPFLMISLVDCGLAVYTPARISFIRSLICKM